MHRDRRHGDRFDSRTSKRLCGDHAHAGHVRHHRLPGENAGEDRIVYGSDLPMRDPRQQLGWVVFSRLSQRAKERILWRNAWNIMCYGF